MDFRGEKGLDTEKFLNRLLLTKDYYRRLTDKKLSLCIGIVFIGIVSLVVQVLMKFNDIFIGKASSVFINNVLFIAAFTILIGLIDVLFFSLPLFDVFKLFKKEVELQNNSRLVVRIMKIQITGYMMIFVPYLLLNLLAIGIKLDKYPLLAQIISLVYFLIPIWYCAIVTRGINAIYSFQMKFRILVFPVVFIWFQLVDVYSLNYIVEKCFLFFLK